MLSKRLRKIAAFVTKDMVAADIGCDHAFLPVYLVQKGICEKAYAMDNKQGPLNSAIQNIKNNHMENKVFPILSDGLENLPEDATCIIIAGMGCELIKSILDGYPDKLTNIKEFVVQSNTHVENLRRYISTRHWTIVDESIVYDYKHSYQIIKFTQSYHKAYSEKQCWMGPCLLQKKEDLYWKYLKDSHKKITEISLKNPSVIDSDYYKYLTETLTEFQQDPETACSHSSLSDSQ